MGYEYRESASEPDDDEEGRVQKKKYRICQINNWAHIASLGFNQNPLCGASFDGDEATLFVLWIDMDSDNRPSAGDLLAAMWEHACNRSLLMLRRICFEAVTEARTQQVVHDTVCPSMGIDWNQKKHSPDGTIILRRPERGSLPQ